MPPKRARRVESEEESSEEEEETPVPKKKPAFGTVTVPVPDKQIDEEGNTYFEISGKRRVTVRPFNGLKLVDIREMYTDRASGELRPGKKGISLSEEQFMGLVNVHGAISQALDDLNVGASSSVTKPAPKKKSASRTATVPVPDKQIDAEGNTYFEISGKRRVTVRSFNGLKLVDIREMYTDRASGELRPGKKGISLSEEQFMGLVNVHDAITQALDELDVGASLSTTKATRATKVESEEESGKEEEETPVPKKPASGTVTVPVPDKQIDAEGNTYFEISGKRRVTVRPFNGLKLVDIREMYTDRASGELRPGKKGISLSEEQFMGLVNVHGAISQALDDLDVGTSSSAAKTTRATKATKSKATASKPASKKKARKEESDEE